MSTTELRKLLTEAMEHLRETLAAPETGSSLPANRAQTWLEKVEAE